MKSGQIPPLDYLRLLFLSAVWGASFLFMRVAAPEFGPIALIFVRIAGAALLLSPILFRPGNRALLQLHWKSFLILGVMNSALPFTLLAFATLTLEAGFTSLLNATTPIFAAIVGLMWLKIPLRPLQIAGLAMGMTGVAILSGNRLDFASSSSGSGWAILATLIATACYGFASHFSKVKFHSVPPLLVSAGSLAFSALVLLPIAIPFWPQTMPSPMACASALGLTVLCTALAFVLFFDILTRTGATTATTITFVIPVFAILWGNWLLDEILTGRMVLGMIIALTGTALTSGLLNRKNAA